MWLSALRVNELISRDRHERGQLLLPFLQVFASRLRVSHLTHIFTSRFSTPPVFAEERKNYQLAANQWHRFHSAHFQDFLSPELNMALA